MKIALLSTDDRENKRRYAENNPIVPTPQEALLQGFAALPEHAIHFICCVQQPVKAPVQLAPNIFYHCLVVPKLGWMRTLYSGCLRATRNRLRQLQPDVVHGQGTERECAMAAVFSGFPNVVTIHGNMRLIAKLNRERPFSFLWLAARLERFVLPRTNGVVCITNHTRSLVQNLAPRTWVLPNAVDKSFFEVRGVPEASGTPVGLCVGTICALKNQNDFIRALDPLAKTTRFKIQFAGQPAQDAYGREFHRLIGERPWCEHIGFINREQLKARLAAASFVVLPTREDNCPMAVLEAMAAGVPVLASKVGGIPDLIVPETTGLFCDPARPESFREGVARLLGDRQWVQQLAATAKAEALRRFHPEVVARKHLEIYRQVLDRPAGDGRG